MIEYILKEGNDINSKEFISYLEMIDNDFPVKLSEKTDFLVFINKIIKYGKVMCVYDNEKLIGTNFFYCNNFDEKLAFFTLVHIDKNYRGRGIGKELLNRVITHCSDLGFKKIQLYTHSTNSAIEFYKKSGFYMVECDRENDVKLEITI